MRKRIYPLLKQYPGSLINKGFRDFLFLNNSDGITKTGKEISSGTFCRYRCMVFDFTEILQFTDYRTYNLCLY